MNPFSLSNITIPPIDAKAHAAAAAHQNCLVKPLGSLGVLEDMAVSLAGIQHTAQPKIEKRRVLVFAADNGLWQEGITSIPQSVTASQTLNMLNGLAGISILTQANGADVQVVDIGIKDPIQHPRLIHKKLMAGTHNAAQGPAMSRETCLQALSIGWEQAHLIAQEGISLLGIGEMGICNTSTSAGVLSALTGQPVSLTAGRGAGITAQQFEKKVSVIQQALDINQPNPEDPVDVLHKVGGLDIAAMAGAFLGAAACGLPVVIDGFISMVAALVAARICPEIQPYLFPSHISMEPGFQVAAQALNCTPYLALNMRLGEGSGCPIAFHLMDLACQIHNQMGLLEQSHMDSSQWVDLREEKPLDIKASQAPVQPT